MTIVAEASRTNRTVAKQWPSSEELQGSAARVVSNVLTHLPEGFVEDKTKRIISPGYDIGIMIHGKIGDYPTTLKLGIGGNKYDSEAGIGTSRLEIFSPGEISGRPVHVEVSTLSPPNLSRLATTLKSFVEVQKFGSFVKANLPEGYEVHENHPAEVAVVGHSLYGSTVIGGFLLKGYEQKAQWIRKGGENFIQVSNYHDGTLPPHEIVFSPSTKEEFMQKLGEAKSTLFRYLVDTYKPEQKVP